MKLTCKKNILNFTEIGRKSRLTISGFITWPTQYLRKDAHWEFTDFDFIIFPKANNKVFFSLIFSRKKKQKKKRQKLTRNKTHSRKKETENKQKGLQNIRNVKYKNYENMMRRQYC